MLNLFRKVIQEIKEVLISVPGWFFTPNNYPMPFIPLKWLSSYTMNGKVRVRYYYLNSFPKSSSPKIYKKEDIELFIDKIKNKETFYYGKTDSWLYQALDRFIIKDFIVAIMGSETPLYESICLFFGGKPVTIEYNKIISDDSRLSFMTVEECRKSVKKFDAAFSISSFEHDGLGRYKDPLNPDGDILAMKNMKLLLKDNGIIFLSVPIGRDTLVWNSRRIYGKIRLPLLLDGWEIIETFGFNEELFDKSTVVQPIFVLRNIVNNK